MNKAWQGKMTTSVKGEVWAPLDHSARGRAEKGEMRL